MDALPLYAAAFTFATCHWSVHVGCSETLFRMPSRTADLDAESAKVHAQMGILQKREDEIQKLIAGMQALKDSIRDERLSLESRSQALEAERYPVNWLPTELLVVIFTTVVACSSTLDADRDTAPTAPFLVPPPIVLSQVCQRWRSVALATSSLWSKILCWGAKSDGHLNRLFIQRSSTALLDLEYRSRSKFLPFVEGNEKENVSSVFAEIFDHSARLRSVSLECRAAEVVEKVLGLLSTPIPSLQALNLSIVTKHPSFSKAVSLLEEGPTLEDDEGADPSKASNLTSLELEEVPLFSLPSYLFTNITTLRLRFLSKRHALPVGTPSYQLTMSTLCRFLALTPLLEDFTLSNTIPLFDTFIPDDNMGTNPGISTRVRVPLPHLKRFEWSYPYPGEVHYFITSFEIPALEKLDIWVEEPRRATEWHISGHHNDSMSQASVRRGRSELWALRDLSLQCDGENAFHALRKFDVPSLQRLEITNADQRARKGSKPFPTMPRLEYMLRDPRLSHLTHLTLSHFDISCEPDRCEAFFGYLPVLTSLSLDTCVGVRRLMKTLGEIVAGPRGLAPGYPERKRRIKVCPRLEAISLWNCEEVNVMDVSAVVTARLDRFDEDSRNPSSADTVVQGTTRKIKPLRRFRYQGRGANEAVSRAMHPMAGGLPDVLSASDFCHPAKIVYLRLDGCTGISFNDIFVLRQLGVVDIVCNGRCLNE